MIRYLALTAALALSGCASTPDPVPPLDVKALPSIPPDIRDCFVGVVDVPAKPLTVAQVERLWKQDRIKAVVMRKCGDRFIAWYDALQAEWGS